MHYVLMEPYQVTINCLEWELHVLSSSATESIMHTMPGGFKQTVLGDGAEKGNYNACSFMDKCQLSGSSDFCFQFCWPHNEKYQ